MKQIWQKFINSKFYLNYKEELKWIPILLLGYILVSTLVTMHDDHTSTFDLYSQLDSLANLIYKCAVIVTISFGILWIAFPQVYDHLHNEFYHTFKDKATEFKDKYALWIFIAILLSVVWISRGVAQTNGDERRIKLLTILDSQLNIRESWGENQGPEVNMILKSVNAPPKNPWCAAYASYDLSLIGVPNPHSAYSPNFAQKKDIIWTPKNQKIKPLLGDTPTFWHANLHRVGHVGFYLWPDKDGGFAVTQEGNSSATTGSFEGDGVHRKKRDPLKFYAISRFIK